MVKRICRIEIYIGIRFELKNEKNEINEFQTKFSVRITQCSATMEFDDLMEVIKICTHNKI